MGAVLIFARGNTAELESTAENLKSLKIDLTKPPYSAVWRGSRVINRAEGKSCQNCCIAVYEGVGILC